MLTTNSGNYRLALGLGAVIFVIAFAMLMGLGDYRFVPAFFLALLLALLSTIVLYLAFGWGEGAPHGSNAPAPAKADASAKPVTDAAASSSDADAEKARAAEAEAAQKAEDDRKVKEAEAARKAEEDRKAAEAEAARKAAEEAKAAKPASADTKGEDYDGDGVVEGENEGTRPAGLDAPRDGKADDLKKIKGVGPKMEQLCNSLGFWHFDQVASWSADEVAWVDANLKGFKGRVSRDNWVEQARLLASGGETEFSKRVGDGEVY